MKQILQSYRNGNLWLADVPEPRCSENAVRIRVEASVVSAGTEKRMLDLAKSSLLQKALKRPDQVQRAIQKVRAEGIAATWQQVNAKLDTPVPLGYSLCGTVVETGVRASAFQVGQRVAAAGAGHASHAQVVSVPMTLVARVPDDLSPEEAAFGTVGAIAMQAVRQAEVSVGEYVGVIGLGLLGNLVVQICRAAGARVAGTDIDPGKRDLALRLGAERTGADIQAVAAELTGGRGLDKVIIAAGSRDSSIIRACPRALRHRGRIVVLGFVGMDCPHQEFYEKELELRMSMSYGPGRYDPNYEERAHDYPYAYVRWTEQRNIESFLHLIAQHRVNVTALVTHRFAFADALDAYALLESGERYMGIVLNYPPTAPESRRPDRVLRAVASPKKTGGSPCIALVGAGGFASGVLAPILQQLKVPVRAVVATRGATAATTAERLSAAMATTDINDVLADDTITHVIVATRHSSHASITEQALRAGKIVHVEKPLCTSREQLEHLQDVVAELGAMQRVHVGFNRRFSPVGAMLANELRNSPAGPTTVVYRINAGALDASHWFYQDAGGRLTAEGCHFIDYCLYLIGQPVLSVSCSQQGVEGRAFDSFVVTLVFADGSQGVVIYSGQGDRSLRKERIEAYRGGCCWILDDWSRLWRFRDGRETRLYSGRQQKGWREELQHVLGLLPQPVARMTWESHVATHRVLFDAIDRATGVPAPAAA